MNSFYQDPQSYGIRQCQWNNSSQVDYVERNDFEAKMIQMLEKVKLGQRVVKFQAKRNTLEQENRADYEEQ